MEAKKVCVVGTRDKASRYKDSYFKKKTKYIDREIAGFWAKGLWSIQDN